MDKIGRVEIGGVVYVTRDEMGALTRELVSRQRFVETNGYGHISFAGRWISDVVR